MADDIITVKSLNLWYGTEGTEGAWEKAAQGEDCAAVPVQPGDSMLIAADDAAVLGGIGGDSSRLQREAAAAL